MECIVDNAIKLFILSTIIRYFDDCGDYNNNYNNYDHFNSYYYHFTLFFFFNFY